jgi:hypothetical protein
MRIENCTIKTPTCKKTPKHNLGDIADVAKISQQKTPFRRQSTKASAQKGKPMQPIPSKPQVKQNLRL